MRFTLDIDDDIARLIEEQIQRTGESFNAAVNRLLRLALTGPPSPSGTLFVLGVFEAVAVELGNAEMAAQVEQIDGA
jgi:hypothetical protein